MKKKYINKTVKGRRIKHICTLIQIGIDTRKHVITADFQSPFAVVVIGSPEFLFFQISSCTCAFTYRAPTSRLDEKSEVRNYIEGPLNNSISQPSIYLSTNSNKATLSTVEKLTRSQSIVIQVDDNSLHLDPEIVKRRATTLAVNMSSQRQGKTANRRRLFVSLSHF